MRGSRGAILATLGAGLLWGSSFAVIKLGLRTIDPYWFVFLRFACASLIALVYLGASGRLGDVAALLRSPLVIWLGVTNAVGFIFQFKGQTLTTAGHAALIINSCTIYVAIASRFVFGERFGPLKTLAVAAGMVGVFLVTTGGRLGAAIGPELRGDVFVLVAAFTWTAFILLDKKIVGERDAMAHGLPGLATIASVSPLLGLMGTVVGVMDAFVGISVQGSASITAVAPGIAEALITTVTGLGVAIPAVIGYNFFASRLALFSGDLQGFSSEFIGALAREGKI